jgi:flavin-dependent dehydrogenase
MGELMQPATPDIEATLTLDAAADRRWDVIVVGAGPAGGSAAVRLARHGLDVLLIDRGRMPRGKLCGCCLSPAALAELRGLGLWGLVEQAVPLERIRLAAGGREAAIDVQDGATLSREALDPAIVAEAIAAGCHWLPQTTATAIDEMDIGGESQAILSIRNAAPNAPPGSPKRERRDGDDGMATGLTCRRLILATGLGDHVRLTATKSRQPPTRTIAARSRIGIGAVLPADAADLPAGELLMAVTRTGYCGIVRLEDGRIDVAAAVDRDALAHAAPADVLARIMAEATRRQTATGESAEHLRDALAIATIRATPALTRSAPLVEGIGGRVFRIGDAAGYVEPFTGEGMGWALAAGRIVAEAVWDAGLGGLAPAVIASGRYNQLHARHFGPRHARCRRVAAGLRMPRLVGFAVRGARLAPWAARLAVPIVTGSRSLQGGFRLLRGHGLL